MEFNQRQDNLAHLSDAGIKESQDDSADSIAHSEVIVPIILSGGGGSRLWPFSTKDTPKQFLPLVENKTLFERALDRVRDRGRFAAPIVVGNIKHAELCEASLATDGEESRLILEPSARNTAPAVVLAAAVVRDLYGADALLLVMPSDHVIEDVAAFHQAIEKGESAARMGRLVTFGVQPNGPDTGYGYLQMGCDLADAPGVKDVARFVEKPALETAEAMVADGDHLWNAGIFLFTAGTFLQEAALLAPAITRPAEAAIGAGERDGIRIVPEAAIFAECVNESIDYAIMERSSRVAVVPMSPGWSDLGSWDALASLLGAGTSVGPITAVDCESCFIRSDGVQVAALGVRDLIIVASGGRLLILPRGRSQEVKKLLSVMDTMAA